jgi:ribonucleotide reductase alpha subunit
MSGLKFEPYFCKDGNHYDSVEWERRDAKITDADGNIKFEMKDVEVPAQWSQLATDILASKYFRKSGVPNERGHEWSLKQVVDRVVDTIAVFGNIHGYFDPDDAANFENDLKWLLVNQYGAFNSPVWFNVGLWHKYKIRGTGQNWAYDFSLSAKHYYQPTNQYERPQASACFIQSVEDDLGSIFDLVKNEASIFKYGGGNGANMSALRGKHESLAGGGKSSGLISFLEVLDAAAGAIKSGGTCLTANTPILTNTGYKRVVDLVDKDFICFSKNIIADRIEAKKAKAFKSGIKKCVRVTTDKGIFEVSHDHPFLLKDDRYLAADQLKEGMRLDAAYSQLSKDNYAQFRLKDSAHMKIHRILARDILCDDIDNRVVHHIDHDRLNNHIDNLLVMDNADHHKLHQQSIPLKQKQEWGSKSVAIQKANGTHVFSNKTFPKKGEKNGMHSTSKFWKDKKRVEKYKQRQREALPVERARVMQFKSQDTKMLNAAYKLINDGYDISTQDKFISAKKQYYLKRSGGGFGINEQKEWVKIVQSRFGGYENFYHELEQRNHKVLKVEGIETQVVYDVQVECDSSETRNKYDNHNFLIGNSNIKLDTFEGRGVFVHNTRRAACLRALDVDHPEILDFINWKVKEEEKAKALIAQGYDSDFNGEAYATVSGQNSNNAVRLTDEFMEAVENDLTWKTTNRTDGEVYEIHQARDIFNAICKAVWTVGDPGVQYHDTINKWNTCKESGRINASNPCFAPGTKITILKDNHPIEINIEDAQVGQLVKSYDIDKEKIVYKRILKAGKTRENTKIIHTGLFCCDGHLNSIKHTPDHLFYDLHNKKYVTMNEQPHLKSAIDNKTYLTFGSRNTGYSDVYDITIEDTHCFFANNILAHNCSEFIFLDENACNLSSLNLVKFWKDGKFDVESFRRAVRILITVQDILVDLGSYPTKEIAKNSHEFRPLGLGYSNLGTLLMLAGYPYDSDEGRTLAALITSIMTGTAYEVSSELAESLGAFEKFEDNKESMDEVFEQHLHHKNILYTKNNSEIGIKKFGYFFKYVNDTWHKLSDDFQTPKFRNAQCTLSAPTGTISLLMDCDTTGIEPAFSLVSHKKLAGGGSMDMVNQAVEKVLKNQHYDKLDIAKVIEHIKSTGTIENTKFLANDDLPIFDCAMPSGSGKRFISADGHIKMLAAVQPFLSSAISKTINVPNEATVEDIKKIFMDSWKLGLKAITVYRDGSKGSQPLTVKKEEKNFSDKDFQVALKKGIELKDGTVITEKQMWQIAFAGKKGAEAGQKYKNTLLKWGESRKLPNTRKGQTWEFKVGGEKVFLRSGEYKDGSLGEIFIDLGYKEGSTVRSLMDQFAISISYSLQYGIPLQTLVDKFSFTKFEPHGFVVGHDHLKTATSIVDAIFRTLSHYYLGDTKQFIADAPPENNYIDIVDKQNNTIGNIQSSKDSDYIGGLGKPLPTANYQVSIAELSKPKSVKNSGNQPPCPECGGIDFLMTGNCFVCVTCGASQGCS